MQVPDICRLAATSRHLYRVTRDVSPCILRHTEALVLQMERSSLHMQEDLWVLQCSRWLRDNSYAQPAGTADVLACQLLQLHRCRTFYQLCKVRDKNLIPVLAGRLAQRPSNASGPASACAAHCAPYYFLTTTLQSLQQDCLALQLLDAPASTLCIFAWQPLPSPTLLPSRPCT